MLNPSVSWVSALLLVAQTSKSAVSALLLVAQTSKSAVSRVSKPASASVRWIPALAAGTMVLVAVAQSWAQGATVSPSAKLMNAELLARGRVVYNNHCAGCHGEKGDGRGPGAYGLNPKPRDLTTGIYKFRSTPPSTLPTDEDLMRTVLQGVPGTSMPAFNLMAHQDLVAVVQYLKTFSGNWQNPLNYGAPMHIPLPPAWFGDPRERASRAAKGKEFYAAACLLCHGEKGDGDGPSAKTLIDSWGQPILPYDLRHPYIRSGKNLTDVYKVLVTGLNGSPMPSFLEATTEDQRWELVAYVDQLRREKRGKRDVEPLADSRPAPSVSPQPVAPPKEKPSVYE